MMKVNEEEHIIDEIKVTYGNYCICKNGERVEGISPVISFTFDNKYIEVETVCDNDWLIKMKLKKEYDITKNISDILYKGKTGFFSLVDEEYNCSLMRLEQNKYQFRFFCKFSDRDQDYIIEINECVRF